MYLAQDKYKILQNIEKEAEKKGINAQPPTSMFIPGKNQRTTKLVPNLELVLLICL
jgi:hypothetical protein